MVNEFLTIAKQDVIKEEKFTDGDLSAAKMYDDYISTDISDGSMSPPETFEKTDKTFLSSGRIKKIDNIYFEPELSLLTGLAGFGFLVESLGDVVSTASGISDMQAGDKRYININKSQNKPFTIYAKGVYSNAVIYAIGAQINELSLALESGDVAVETNCFASRQLLDETNLERGKSAYDGESISYSHLKKIRIADFTKSDGILTVPSLESAWTNVGCDIQSGNFEMNFDLDEDTGTDFCNDGWTSGFKNGTIEITSDIEVTQDSDVWMKLTNGGTLEFSKLARKSVMYSLEDDEFKVDIILPYGVVGLEGASLEADNPTETINFSNETADVSYDNETFYSCEGLIVLTKL